MHTKILQLGILVLVIGTVVGIVSTGFNSPAGNTNTKSLATSPDSESQSTNDQSGKATIVVGLGKNSDTNLKKVNLIIEPGPLLPGVMTDIIFAKITLKFDPNKLTLNSNPVLNTENWGFSALVQTKAESELKNKGKIIIAGAITENQNTHDKRTRFASYEFKRRAGATGKTIISVDLPNSQLINSPSQEAKITAQNLEINL